MSLMTDTSVKASSPIVQCQPHPGEASCIGAAVLSTGDITGCIFSGSDSGAGTSSAEGPASRAL